MHCGHAIVPPGGDRNDGTEVSIKAFGRAIMYSYLYYTTLSRCLLSRVCTDTSLSFKSFFFIFLFIFLETRLFGSLQEMPNRARVILKKYGQGFIVLAPLCKDARDSSKHILTRAIHLGPLNNLQMNFFFHVFF